MLSLGVDFTSAPRPAKPITIAVGVATAGALRLARIDSAPDFDAFDRVLATRGPWTGGFDLPFGLPRALLEGLGWPHECDAGLGAWERLVLHLEALPRPKMVEAFRGWCDARPPGSKFAHRATDLRAGSSPSMKWVNPPVAFMLQAGAPRLLAAGVTLPGMHAGDPARTALEAYPGAVARAVVGRTSYKSDRRAGDTPGRIDARRAILAALERGEPLGVPVALPAALRQSCLADARGDRLDAVLCAVQAAWGHARREENFGLPPGFDPVEGWIVGS